MQRVIATCMPTSVSSIWICTNSRATRAGVCAHNAGIIRQGEVAITAKRDTIATKAKISPTEKCVKVGKRKVDGQRVRGMLLELGGRKRVEEIRCDSTGTVCPSRLYNQNHNSKANFRKFSFFF